MEPARTEVRGYGAFPETRFHSGVIDRLFIAGKVRLSVILALFILVVAVGFGVFWFAPVDWGNYLGTDRKNVIARLDEFDGPVRLRLEPLFLRAGAVYPPARIGLVGLKTEKRLELYAPSGSGTWSFIKEYPILAASGKIGPKLREGDLQVPEGVYGVDFLNPNSRFHLSIRVSYPNAFDRLQAGREGRKNLGGDIMIHGKNVSIGCIAVGDEAAEELFVLAARTGRENVKVIISPVDFRIRELPALETPLPGWTSELYAQIRRELSFFPK